jgi:predicted component of type VI protein secretion system
MEPRQFDQLLEKVHAAIRDVDNVDEQGRELLKDLSEDIQGLLNRTENRVSLPSVDQQLRDSIRHFEVTHPTLTALLSELSAILSNAGI